MTLPCSRVLPLAPGAIRTVIPPSRGDLWLHPSAAVPRPLPSSRPRLPGASPRTGSISSPRSPAALNLHRPQTSIRGLVQSGFCAIPRSHGARWTVSPTRDRAEPSFIFRRCRPVIPRSCRPVFRHDVARLRRPAGCWGFGEKRAAGQSFMADLGRVRRRLSPARSMRWALWTRRSRMASA